MFSLFFSNIFILYCLKLVKNSVYCILKVTISCFLSFVSVLFSPLIVLYPSLYCKQRQIYKIKYQFNLSNYSTCSAISSLKQESCCSHNRWSEGTLITIQCLFSPVGVFSTQICWHGCFTWHTEKPLLHRHGQHSGPGRLESFTVILNILYEGHYIHIFKVFQL